MQEFLTEEASTTLAVSSFTKDELSEEQLAAITTITSLIPTVRHSADLTPLLRAYDSLYFRSLLVSETSLVWSNRMTLCAGTCTLFVPPQYPKRSVRVTLSTALLKTQTRSDIVNTLLHELIHAYFFLTMARHSNNEGGHGPGFQRLAFAINDHGSYNISITHEFHEEVEKYRVHVWKCDGPCKEELPCYGEVRRATDRAPGKADTWYEEHERTCGGTWTKVKGPGVVQKNRLDGWIVKKREREDPDEKDISKVTVKKSRTDDGNPPTPLRTPDLPQENNPKPSVEETISMVECPVCTKSVPEADINNHLDTTHGFGVS